MKNVLTITSDASLTEGLANALGREDVTFERAEDWESGRDRLVRKPYQAICLDYETMKLEGHATFIQLDNIIQKEDVGAILLLRGDSPRAVEFVETLDSFAAAVNLAEDPVENFEQALDELLASEDEAEAGGADGGRVIDVSLPDIERGSLEELSLARLIHTIQVRGESGLLKLSTGSMERWFAFRDGALVPEPNVKVAGVDNLKAAFAWERGRFQFQPDDSIEGETADPSPILLKGANNHLDQREAMNSLMPVMQKYAGVTSRWEQLAETFGSFDDLQTFIDHCDGETTLETVLSAVASTALKGFQAGYFAVETDLIALDDEPFDGPVRVIFDGQEELEASANRTSGASTDQNPAPTADPGATAVQEPSTEDREAQLREMHDHVQAASPYEIFDLWEGCGEAEVRSRFFKMVKKHHPDSYGGNISPEGKKMAEEIFIAIKKAQSKLLRKEDEQTIPPEEGRESQSGEEPLEVNSSLDEASVTAMGSERLGSEATAARGQTDIPDQAVPDGRDEESEVEDDPDATIRPGSDRGSPVDQSGSTDEKRQTEGSSPISLGNGTKSSSSETTSPPSGSFKSARSSTDSGSDNSEDRTAKINRLKNRAADSKASSGFGNKSSSGMGGSKSVDPDERKRKLKSLRENSSTVTERKIKNLEPPETDKEAKEFFNQGYKAFKREDYKKALPYFEKAFNYDKEHGLYKTFYANMLFVTGTGEHGRIKTLLREAIKSDNEQAKPDAHLFLGRVLKVQENDQQAKKHFRAALELNPESLEAKRELRVYALRGEEEFADEASEPQQAAAGNQTSEEEELSQKEKDENFLKDILNKELF